MDVKVVKGFFSSKDLILSKALLQLVARKIISFEFSISQSGLTSGFS